MRGRFNQSYRKTGKRGYIVLELVVVLVILALLAAFLLPPVIDNIRIAKETAEIAQTQTAAVTLQALLTMTYANEIRNPDGKSLNLDDLIWFDENEPDNIMLTHRAYAELMDLASVEFGFIDKVNIADRVTLISFRYHTQRGSIIEFNRGDYRIIYLY